MVDAGTSDFLPEEMMSLCAEALYALVLDFVHAGYVVNLQHRRTSFTGCMMAKCWNDTAYV